MGGGCIPRELGPNNVGTIHLGHACSENMRVYEGPGIMSPRKILKFEVLKLLEMHQL